MANRIIYKDDSGDVQQVVPTQWGLDQVGGDIDKIAQKDVPHGRPYKIIDELDLPIRDGYRNAWDVNSGDLTDGVGSASHVMEDFV
jgi:hypothetical protein